LAKKEGQPLIKGGVPLFEWRPNAPVKDTLEEDVTSTDNPVFIIEDVFEIPGDDADADLSDNVENGPDNDIFYDAPDNNPVNGDDLAETDDPAGFQPDGLSLAPTTKTERLLASNMILIAIEGAQNLRQTRIRMPIGTISGATGEELMITDSITRWTIPRILRVTSPACRCYSRPRIVCMRRPTTFISIFVGIS
jgi:hypothetical protein